MNTICKLADIDIYLLYFIDIKTVIRLLTISKDQNNLIINLDFAKEICALMQKYGYKYGYKKIIDISAAHNYISLIKWISESFLEENEFQYTQNAIDNAAACGHIDVLDWFANSKYKFKYSTNAIDFASDYGNIDVLNWFANSKYEFKYTINAIYYALIYHKLEILKWFDESKRRGRG